MKRSIDNQIKFESDPIRSTSLEPRLLNGVSFHTKVAPYIFSLNHNNVSSRGALTLLVSLVLLIVGSAESYAHGVLSQEIEPGKIRFSYDDASPMANGYISVLDKEGKEIATGQTDAVGVFDYSTYENVGEISVTDTHGHHRTHVLGVGQDVHATGHTHDHDHHSSGNTTGIIAVVVILLAFAAVFYCVPHKR